MNYAQSEIKLINTVLSIGSTKENSTIFLCDSAHGIFAYSRSDKKLLYGKRVSKQEEKHHPYSKAITCSDTGLFSECIPSGNTNAIYEIKDDKLSLKTKIKSHRAPISCSVFSGDGAFFTSGGEDGKVFIYSTETCLFYAILPVQSDYISSMRFDSKNHKIAIATFDCKISIYDLRRHIFTDVINTPSVVNDCEFFTNNNRLFFVCKDGESGIYDLKHKKLRISKEYSAWLQNCAIVNHHALITGRFDKLYVHDLKSNSKFFEIELGDIGASYMRKLHGCAYICLLKGTVMVIDLESGRDEFIDILQNGDFKTAKEYCEEKNIFLKLDLAYATKREELWPEALKKISVLLVKGDLDGALELAAPYLESNNIQSELNALLSEQSTLNTFVTAINEKQYAKAYAIANEREYIQNLDVFKNLENYYQKILERAQSLLEEESSINIKRVKTLLEPFLEVPQKSHDIENLITNYAQYKSISNATRAHDYKEAMNLAKQYTFLKSTRAYYKAYGYFEEMLLDVQNKIATHISPELLESINTLLEIEPFIADANELKMFYENQDKLKELSANKYYQACYALVERYPKLASVEAYLQMEEGIVETFKRATALAQNGKTNEVYELLSPFLTLKEWKNRLDNIFQIAYFYEIKNANLKDLSLDWKVILSRYASYFGKDCEIVGFCAVNQMSDIWERISVPQVEVRYEKTILN